jgi:hypothetical protein
MFTTITGKSIDFASASIDPKKKNPSKIIAVRAWQLDGVRISER